VPDLSITDVERRLESFGLYVPAYIQELKKHRSQSWRRDLRKLLALKINYHPQDIHRAIGRALNYKVFEPPAIERFLSAHAQLRHGVKLSLNPIQDPEDEQN
jgi:hypothetical protein